MFEVRVGVLGAVIKCLSRTEPVRGPDGTWTWTPINGTPYGDTIGFIDCDSIDFVTWKPAAQKTVDEVTWFERQPALREKLIEAIKEARGPLCRTDLTRALNVSPAEGKRLIDGQIEAGTVLEHRTPDGARLIYLATSVR